MGDEDRLPWLEAVEEDEGGDGPSVAKLIAAIVIGLVAIGVIVGGLFWLGNRGGPGADNDLIAAPEGEYKVRPENPGGMNVSGEGDVSAAASAGAQPQGNLERQCGPRSAGHPGAASGPPRPARRPAPAPAPARAAPAPPRPAPAPPRPAPQPGRRRRHHPARRLLEPGGRGPRLERARRAASATSRRSTIMSSRPRSAAAPSTGCAPPARTRPSVCRRLQVAGEACSVVS